MEPDTTLLQRVRVVLVGTQHPGNIGSAARAMKTMGLTRLALVAPMRFPDPAAEAMAAGADDVLAASERFDTLADAIADCRLVLGCTARSRRVALDEFSPRAAAGRMLDAATAGVEIALVFGRERTGLENDELQLCHAAVHIDANPGYSSLNLAAAVQVLSYELRMALLARAAGVSTGAETVAASMPTGPAAAGPLAVRSGHSEDAATHAQMEGFFAQLGETLDAIDFHKGRAPDSAMRKLRRIFLRSDLDARELRLLRGILADAQRMARLAGQATSGDG